MAGGDEERHDHPSGHPGNAEDSQTTIHNPERAWRGRSPGPGANQDYGTRRVHDVPDRLAAVLAYAPLAGSSLRSAERLRLPGPSVVLSTLKWEGNVRPGFLLAPSLKKY